MMEALGSFTSDTLGWISVFLKLNEQRVVVDGYMYN